VLAGALTRDEGCVIVYHRAELLATLSGRGSVRVVSLSLSLCLGSSFPYCEHCAYCTTTFVWAFFMIHNPDFFPSLVSSFRLVVALMPGSKWQMVAVRASEDEVLQVIGDRSTVDVAAVNSPTSVVLSGPNTALTAVCERHVSSLVNSAVSDLIVSLCRLTAASVAWRAIDAPAAFHSAATAVLQGRLVTALTSLLSATAPPPTSDTLPLFFSSCRSDAGPLNGTIPLSLCAS
jgi:hypothetical protein